VFEPPARSSRELVEREVANIKDELHRVDSRLADLAWNVTAPLGAGPAI